MADTPQKNNAGNADSSSELNLDELDPGMPMSSSSESGSRYNEEIPEKLKSSSELEAFYDIPVQVSAVLGKSSMQVHQLLKLGRGAVVELDRKIGEAIDIYVNNRLVARGEVVVVDDRLGITMTEIIKAERS